MASYPAPINYFQEVAEGNVIGHTAFTRVGFNPVISSTLQLIGGVNAVTPFMPSVAINIEAISASSVDTSTGTGVSLILVTGLDSGFNEISEIITLGGTAAVISSNKFIRVYEATSIGCGTYRGTNTGDITVRGSSGGTSFLLIGAGQGMALTSHYCVPASKTMFVRDFFVAIEGNKNVSISVFVGAGADVVAAPFVPVLAAARNGGLSAAFEITFSGVTGAIPAKTDFWVNGATTAGAAAVTVTYSSILKSN